MAENEPQILIEFDKPEKAKEAEKAKVTMAVHRYALKVVFETAVLGTQPQKDVASEYLAGHFDDGQLPEDELSTLPEELKKGTTAFHKLNGQPIYYDYMVKGFFKEAGQAFNGLRGVKNLRSKLDNYLFIRPRQIPLRLPETMLVPDGTLKTATVDVYDPRENEYQSKEVEVPAGFVRVPAAITYRERPLRGMTAQGPRTSLARSEELPAGTWFECQIHVFQGMLSEPLLRDLLGYGEYKGFGQWRNGGNGSMSFELEQVDA